MIDKIINIAFNKSISKRSYLVDCFIVIFSENKVDLKVNKNSLKHENHAFKWCLYENSSKQNKIALKCNCLIIKIIL